MTWIRLLVQICTHTITPTHAKKNARAGTHTHTHAVKQDTEDLWISARTRLHEWSLARINTPTPSRARCLLPCPPVFSCLSLKAVVLPGTKQECDSGVGSESSGQRQLTAGQQRGWSLFLLRTLRTKQTLKPSTGALWWLKVKCKSLWNIYLSFNYMQWVL